MAKFYEIDARGETVGCRLTLREAHAEAAKWFHSGTEYTITRVEVPVTAESIRLLLAQGGGYAIEAEVVFEGRVPKAEDRS